MELLYVLLILLLVTRTFGEIAHRLQQPALVGELIAGIALGAIVTLYPDLVPALSRSKEDPVFVALSQLGMFFLMLYGGVELRASELAEVSGKSFVVAGCGLVLPVIVGFGLGWEFLPQSNLKLAQCLLIGTALAVTAVPVSIRVLMDLGQLNSPAGKTIVAAAIIDDVLSLILLAFLTGIIATGGLPDTLSIVKLVS